MLRAVNWSGVDMVITPHRGVWGLRLPDGSARSRVIPDTTVGGPPENAFSGVLAAQKVGFRTVEYDFITARDYSLPAPVCSPEVTPVGRAVVNHFLDLRGFTSYAGRQTIPLSNIGQGSHGFIFDHEYGEEDQKLILRDRDGRLPGGSDADRFIDALEFLKRVRQEAPGTVLAVDLKFPKKLEQYRPGTLGDTTSACIGFCDEFTSNQRKNWSLNLISELSRIAEIHGLEEHLIIKISQSNGISPMDLEACLGDRAYKLNYAPQPLIGGSALDKQRVLDWIDFWMVSGLSQSVMFWDTTIPSRDSWMAQRFSHRGRSYGDLTHYLVDRTRRRPAIWTPDPGGPGGRNANYAMEWVTYGNTTDALPERRDTRGDALASLFLRGAPWAVVTTDRPDLLIQIRNALRLNDALPDSEGIDQ